MQTAKSVFSCEFSSPYREINSKKNFRYGSIFAFISIVVISTKSKLKLKFSSFFLSLSSPSSWMDTPSSLSSPPQRKICFWCSVKSTSKKKKRKSSILADNLD